MTNPIMVQSTQDIAKPLFNVMLGVELSCERVRFFENFTLCDLAIFYISLGNIFLNVY